MRIAARLVFVIVVGLVPAVLAASTIPGDRSSPQLSREQMATVVGAYADCIYDLFQGYSCRQPLPCKNKDGCGGGDCSTACSGGAGNGFIYQQGSTYQVPPSSPCGAMAVNSRCQLSQGSNQCVCVGGIAGGQCPVTPDGLADDCN